MGVGSCSSLKLHLNLGDFARVKTYREGGVLLNLLHLDWDIEFHC